MNHDKTPPAPDAEHIPTTGGTRRPGVLAWLRMLRFMRQSDRRGSQHLQQWDLSLAQFDVLAQVGAHDGIAQQDLAERLLVTQGNITQLIDRLEQRGLVRRCPAGRSKHLRLTEAGRAIFAAAVPAQEDLIAEQFASLTDDEQHTLLRLLTRLTRANQAK